MQVELKISDEYSAPKVVIYTNKMTDEIASLMKQLAADQPKMLAAFDDETVLMLSYDNIYRFYSSSGKVFAETENKKYLLRLRLYELEDRLDGSFVRISNSEIINLNRVKNFDLSFSGTICVSLSNGTATYVSRRYVKKSNSNWKCRGGIDEEKNNFERFIGSTIGNSNKLSHYSDDICFYWRRIVLSGY